MPYYLAVILYVLFLVVPGMPAPYDGIPLDRIHELATLAILPAFFIFLPANAGKVRKLHWIATILIAMKITIGYVAPQEGLIATYYAGNTEQVHEKSTDFLNIPPNGTRIDNEIHFKQEGYPKKGYPFPLWFFNDNTRFSKTDVDMRTAPFSAEWKGYLHVPEKADPLLLESDGTSTLNAILPTSEAVTPISITYTASEKPERFLKLSWKNDAADPLREGLYSKPYTLGQLRTRLPLKILDGILKIAALVLLIILARERCAKTPLRIWLTSWHPYLFASYAAGTGRLLTDLLSNAESSYFNFLGRGNDTLTYETYARYIRFTGNWSIKIFENGSYYYQPYYYFLTIGHYFGGEGIFAVTAMQGIALAVAATCIAVIGAYSTGPQRTIRKIWPLALLPLIIIATPHIKNEAFLLFPSAAGALGAAATGALLLAGKNNGDRELKKRFFFFGGIALGLGFMSRFNFLIWIPWILLWMLASFGKRAWMPATVFLAGFAIVIGPMIARNRLVSNNWEIVTRSNPTVNFLGSLPVEVRGYSGDYNHAKITTRMGRVFDGRATPAIEWIMDHPKKYIHLLTGKITETAAWFPWQFGIFIFGSCFYLCKPKLLSPHARRSDYLLIGMFPILQVVGIIIMSNNNMRYHLPAVLYMAVWAPLCVIMVLNVFRLRGAEQEKEAGNNDIPIETGGTLPS